MNIYYLRKGSEVVEVTEGREARRDQLIAAGYEWTNAPSSTPMLNADASGLAGGEAPAWLRREEEPENVRDWMDEEEAQ